MCPLLVHQFLGLLSHIGSTLNWFLGPLQDMGKINAAPLKSQSQSSSTSSTMKKKKILSLPSVTTLTNIQVENLALIFTQIERRKERGEKERDIGEG